MMPLSSEQIAAIIKGLGEGDTERDTARRRRAARVKHRDVVTIIPYADGLTRTEHKAMLVDFSSRGVAIQFNKLVPSGSQFVLMLPQEAGAPLKLLCSVAHCRPRPAGNYEIGAEFLGLAAVEDALTDASADEARRIAASMFD
jgi:hypothetical protein